MLCVRVKYCTIASLLSIHLTMTELETLKMTSCYQLQWENVASSYNTLQLALVTFSCSPISQEVTTADGSTCLIWHAFQHNPPISFVLGTSTKRTLACGRPPKLVLALHRVSNWGSFKCNANVPPPLIESLYNLA